VDVLFTIVTIASFLVGILFGGKFALQLFYQRQWPERRIVALGIALALLTFLLSPIPFFDLIFQLAESLVGGGVAGIGLGLAVYAWVVHIGNVEAFNVLWAAPIFSDDERRKLSEAMQKHNR
jgi:hypothetical protein